MNQIINQKVRKLKKITYDFQDILRKLNSNIENYEKLSKENLFSDDNISRDDTVLSYIKNKYV